MFIIVPTVYSTVRVFIPNTPYHSMRHDVAKRYSVWNGHDKTEDFNNVECYGYEMETNKVHKFIHYVLTGEELI